MSRSPDNLSGEAIGDFDAILARSLAMFGPTQATIMRDRLMVQFGRIAAGSALGRAHPELPFRRPVRSLLVKPFLVFYDSDSRVVTRIIDGGCDLSALFAIDAG